MAEKEVTYRVGGLNHKGFLASPDAKAPVPAVLICHAWGGVDTFVRDKAREIAKLGYTGLALDMYGEGKTGNSHDECAALMTPLLEDREELKTRVAAGLAALKSQDGVDPNRCVAIGYCFGGLTALDLARSGADLKGVVSFHGLLSKPPFDPAPIRAKILVLHGYNDPMVPPKDVTSFEEEMNSIGCDWQLHSFGNTMHAFTNPVANDKEFGTVYDNIADKRSWQMMLNFLEEAFQQD